MTLRETEYLQREADDARFAIVQTLCDLGRSVAAAVHPRYALRRRRLPATLGIGIGLFGLLRLLRRKRSLTTGTTGVRPPCAAPRWNGVVGTFGAGVMSALIERAVGAMFPPSPPVGSSADRIAP